MGVKCARTSAPSTAEDTLEDGYAFGCIDADAAGADGENASQSQEFVPAGVRAGVPMCRREAEDVSQTLLPGGVHAGAPEAEAKGRLTISGVDGPNFTGLPN